MNLINSRARLSNTEFMQKHTLKELADIGAKHAHSCLNGNLMQCNSSVNAYDFADQENARLAFTKAILDAIGYEFPKDEEREAFDVWWKDNKIAYVNENDAFKAWKAGREELRKAINKPSYSMPPSYAGITLLGTKPNEPEWIPWNGGKCPLSDKVKKWEYKMRNGWCLPAGVGSPKFYRWNHVGSDHDIIAYRVWE